MTNFSKDKSLFHISIPKQIKSEWLPFDDGSSGFVQDAEPSWLQEFKEAGFTELDHKLVLSDISELKGISQLPLSFQDPLYFDPNQEDDLLTLSILVDEDDRIVTIQSSLASSSPSPALGTDLFAYQSFLNLDLPDKIKKAGKITYRFLRKTIKKVVGYGKKVLAWPKHLRKWLYEKSDLTIFKPEGGFGLKKLGADGKFVPCDTMDNSGPILLFIHGIFSNVNEAFNGLGQAVLAELVSRYGNRVYGFDHPTFSASTLENSLELVPMIPKGAKLDIICHSRGAQLTRCLLEHKDCREKVSQLNVGHVLYVAGACKGSPLASDKVLDRFHLMMAGLKLIKPIALLPKILELLASIFHNAPGITCLDPKADLIKQLDQSIPHNHAKAQCFCRANYDSSHRPIDFADEIFLDQLTFDGKGNDLVVPFGEANLKDFYATAGHPETIEGVNFGSSAQDQDQVYHTKFFEQEDIRDKVLQLMSGQGDGTAV